MRRAVCLALSGLFLLLIAIAAAVTTTDDAFAERSTNYPGFGCLAANESLGHIKRGGNYVYNPSASAQWVYCPVVRRLNWDDYPHQVHINVYDGSPTADVVCYYYIAHPFGVLYEFDVSYTTGVGQNSCQVDFDNQTPTKDQWYHKIVVQLPAYDSTNGSSRVLSYEVFEDEIP